MRSESERSFDECQIRRARLQSLGLAYLSPQNKALAQSFRYMRNKPTIIAFKTPSLENCDARISSSSLGSVGPPVHSPERQVEEGRGSPFSPEIATGIQLKPMNYPVGKPLEVGVETYYDCAIFQLIYMLLLLVVTKGWSTKNTYWVNEFIS